MASGFSLADQLFNAEKVGYLAGLFAASDARFDQAGFEAAVMARLGEFALKQRINWIADCLGPVLPGAFTEAAARIVAALPPPLDPTRTDDDFGDFIFAPLGEYVVRNGMETPGLALDVLEQITQRFSMEYAIRAYLNQWPEQTMARMEVWAGHENYHVRRLVSEGTRPRLPWGMKIGLGATGALPLLDRLYADKTRFVTRSVANHLNDISKLNPEAVLERLARWQGEGQQDAKEMQWLTSHALRGLVKAGHVGALEMLGYRADAPVRVAGFTLEQTRVPVGEQLKFAVELVADQESPVLVDYVIHYYRGRNRGGGEMVPRVKKLKTGVVQPGRVLKMTKAYRVPRQATTVKVVPGPHRIGIQVNGRVLAERDFEVV
ncbi:MAG: hypothetical protein CSA70_01530 [Rhodobacterales bacterium]|nr:MAG: hypothetical protein CSA70_01530 [Rhodobacterales bacterium]